MGTVSTSCKDEAGTGANIATGAGKYSAQGALVMGPCSVGPVCLTLVGSLLYGPFLVMYIVCSWYVWGPD